MKLLFCKSCQDVIRLFETERACRCGAVRGRYVNETLAIYSGEGAVPLGFANRDFAGAVRQQPETGDGARFTAFVIPKKCPTFERE